MFYLLAGRSEMVRLAVNVSEGAKDSLSGAFPKKEPVYNFGYGGGCL